MIRKVPEKEVEVCDLCGRESTTTLELPAPAPVWCRELLAVFVVNKNIKYEHEVLGIYDTIEQAREHCEKCGMSAWITEHKMNAPGNGLILARRGSPRPRPTNDFMDKLTTEMPSPPAPG